MGATIEGEECTTHPGVAMGGKMFPVHCEPVGHGRHCGSTSRLKLLATAAWTQVSPEGFPYNSAFWTIWQRVRWMKVSLRHATVRVQLPCWRRVPRRLERFAFSQSPDISR